MFIKLDATDSEDEDEAGAALRRTLLASKWSRNDDEAGPSKPTGGPGSDDDDGDDGGDYSQAIYNSLGIN